MKTGSGSDRATKKFTAQVDAINGLEEQIAKLSDDDLGSSVTSLRERLEAGSSLDDLLSEASARVREAAKRALGQRHYDVQLMGGSRCTRVDLRDGSGEGKTLVATLAVFLNAIPERASMSSR